MPTKIEFLINRIGEAALDYVNGTRKDKHDSSSGPYKDLNYEQFLKMTDELALQRFIADAMRETFCKKDKPGEDKYLKLWQARESAADTSQRRDNLEYLFAVYVYAKMAILNSATLTREGWDQLEEAISNCIYSCDKLMGPGVQFEFEFNGQAFHLNSFCYQKGFASMMSSAVGTLGSKVNSIIFEGKLDREKSYKVQVIEMIQAHRQLALSEQLPLLIQTTALQKAQILALTESLAQVTETNKALLARLDIGDTEVKALQERASEQARQIESLTSELTTMRDHKSSLMRRFGMHKVPGTPASVTLDKPTEHSEAQVSL